MQDFRRAGKIVPILMRLTHDRCHKGKPALNRA